MSDELVLKLIDIFGPKIAALIADSFKELSVDHKELISAFRADARRRDDELAECRKKVAELREELRKVRK